MCITNLKCISEFFYRFVLFSVQLAGCDLHVSILPRGPYTAHVGSSLVFTCLRILNSSNSYGTIGLHQQYLYPIREILSSHCHCKMEIMVDTLERKWVYLQNDSSTWFNIKPIILKILNPIRLYEIVAASSFLASLSNYSGAESLNQKTFESFIFEILLITIPRKDIFDNQKFHEWRGRHFDWAVIWYW